MAGLLLLYTHNPASTSSHCLPMAPSCNALKSLELLACIPIFLYYTGSDCPKGRGASTFVHEGKASATRRDQRRCCMLKGEEVEGVVRDTQHPASTSSHCLPAALSCHALM